MTVSKAGRPLLIVAVLGIAILLALIFTSRSSTSVQSAPLIAKAAVQEQEKAGLGLPARLKIPKLGVDAQIDPMGLTPGGAMEAPSGGRNVGWYRFGSHPGNPGSAVIAGHYGFWKNGERSVFDDLGKLRAGDSLYVEDKLGVVAAFVVRETRRYDPQANAPEVFTATDGKAHLNLITCEGAWNAAAETYAKRLVVFADRA